MKFTTILVSRFEGKIDVVKGTWDNIAKARDFVDSWIHDPQVISAIVVDEVMVSYRAEKTQEDHKWADQFKQEQFEQSIGA